MDRSDAVSRRVDRLRHELDDEGVRLPDEPAVRALVLSEIDYARHPHTHEGTPTYYGAILSGPDLLDAGDIGPISSVDIGDASLAVVRRLADGRSSFLARSTAGADHLICFDRTREYESSVVHVSAATGAVVVQRLAGGWVRICSRDAVATWDGAHWSMKPVAPLLAARLHRSIPAADPDVLAHIVEFCVHWLGAGRVGASLVWRIDGDPHELGHLGVGTAVALPVLDMTCRQHFAPLLNALGQFDRAALVDAAGTVTTVGVQIRASDRARRVIPAYRGTRHTAALRFSADEPRAVVFVVSSGGMLSVCWNGQLLEI